VHTRSSPRLLLAEPPKHNQLVTLALEFFPLRASFPLENGKQGELTSKQVRKFILAELRATTKLPSFENHRKF